MFLLTEKSLWWVNLLPSLTPELSFQDIQQTERLTQLLEPTDLPLPEPAPAAIMQPQ